MGSPLYHPCELGCGTFVRYPISQLYLIPLCKKKKQDSNENFDCASRSVQRLCLYMHSELVPSRHAWTSGWLRLLTSASKLLVVSTRGQDARNRLGQSCTYTCACTGATYKLANACLVKLSRRQARPGVARHSQDSPLRGA